MNAPVLVIMAAGMGSRYGGLKQIDPIDDQGNVLMDYAIYDAKRAGFMKVIFIIKSEDENTFKEVIGNRLERHIEVAYVHQSIEDIPDGFKVPEGRVKPWGTGHAIRACRHIIDGPFVVINADDYYGEEAFRLAADFFKEGHQKEPNTYMMVGYQLNKTLTDNGFVSRGICDIDEQGMLVDIVERTKIMRGSAGIFYTDEVSEQRHILMEDQVVSMNFWAFDASFMKAVDEGFLVFMEKGAAESPKKAEYFLPTVVKGLIDSKSSAVAVKKTEDQWYGMTYSEDREVVVRAIQTLKEKGTYPQIMWQ